jgi:hypothetical protein
MIRVVSFTDCNTVSSTKGLSVLLLGTQSDFPYCFYRIIRYFSKRAGYNKNFLSNGSTNGSNTLFQMVPTHFSGCFAFVHV